MTVRPRSSGESGETLIEVLVAVVIMAGIGVVFLTGLAVAARNSSTQAGRATAHALLISVSERLRTVAFVDCARPTDYTPALDAGDTPDGYSVHIVGVHGWNGKSYDDVTARLAADVAPTDKTVELDDASGFPGTEPFRILIRDTNAELMTVTKRDGTKLTVSRGTEPSEHAAEATPTVQVCPALQRIDLVVTRAGGATESRSVTVRGDLPVGASK